MSEDKRYIDNGYEAIEDQSFTDTETDKTYYVNYFDEIVDLLNEQDETIKKLKKENKRLQIELNSQDDYIDYLEKHNEKLKERIVELASNDKVIFVSL